MKGNGLSSNTRNLLKKANRQSIFASQQVNYLAAKEKQRSLRIQADKARLDAQKWELQAREASVK